jgi:hypothetical protein
MSNWDSLGIAIVVFLAIWAWLGLEAAATLALSVASPLFFLISEFTNYTAGLIVLVACLLISPILLVPAIRDKLRRSANK